MTDRLSVLDAGGVYDGFNPDRDAMTALIEESTVPGR